MGHDMIELHYISDNSPVSVNVNCITHFCKNGLLKSKDEIEIHGTAVFMLGNHHINVTESYDDVKARINNIKNRIRIDNLHI